ncbi:hypothetical protein LQ948_16970 [Jiella sp. MQZ9-1]|uniref:Uncharacterized protein n=1 Tax=Jiella flava TaxID=2816857 RepID=A0A939FVZ6_9HYPH|nr:hypothetical protein [Jiella flava]MBO0662532.1 hypothetical protein [Jiella flava]MCD2472903.1 hypothetical protein [Jiella flava]
MVHHLVIHIGDAKCGSTSIQTSLYDHAHELAAKDILYRAHRRGGGHSRSIVLIGETIGKLDSEDLKPSQFALMADIQRESPKFGRAILSAETFIRSDPSRVLDLFLDAMPSVKRIDVIAYVRPPVSRYLSAQQQRLKTVHTVEPPSRPNRDTLSMLQAWQREARVASLDVRLFDPSRFPDHSVVRDFETVIRDLFDLDGLTLPNNRDNTSLSAEQIMVLQKINRDSAKNPQHFSDARGHLFNFFVNLNQPVLFGTKPKLCAEAAALAAHASRDYVKQMNLAFPDLKMPDQSMADAPQIQKDWSNIGDIFASADKSLVEDIALLVPEWNARLRDGCLQTVQAPLSRISKAHPLGEDHAFRLIAGYWAKRGCKAAGDALLTSRKGPLQS